MNTPNRRTFLFSFLFLGSLLSPFPSRVSAEPQPKVESNLGFSLKLFSQLGESKGNLAFSPFSIEEALGMCHFGAKGETARELAAALDFPAATGDERLQILAGSLTEAKKNKEFVFGLANALYLQKDYQFESAYLEGVKERYLAEVEKVDFIKKPKDAKDEINSWVEDKTENRIKNLLSESSINEDTRAILVNAIYFKADWQQTFEKRATRPAEFSPSDSKAVSVPFMNAQKYVPYAENEDYQLLEMPYQGNHVSMIFLLPKKKDGLPAVERGLSESTLRTAFSTLGQTEVSISLPKFRVESKMNLPKAFQALGVKAAFDAKLADFSGIDATKTLFISQIIHQAFVEVDEKGTEAAAATVVSMVAGAAMVHSEPKRFHADHPFLFFIRERSTGSILFLGRVENPA